MNLKRFKILPKRHQEAVKSAYELYQKEFGKEPSPKEFNMLMDGVVKKFPYDKEERAQEAKRDAARTLAGLGQGALSLVDLPFDAFDLAVTGAQYAGHKLAPSYISKPEGLGRFSPQISHKFRKYVDEKTGGLSEPVTEGEEYLDLGAQVLGGIASPGAVANIASKGLKGAQASSQISSKLINAAEKTNDFLAQMGKWNKVNVGSSFGGAYAAHAAMKPEFDEEGNVTESPGLLKGLTAGLAGAVAGGKAPGAIQKAITQSPIQTLRDISNAPKNALAKTTASYYKFNPEMYDKYQNIGNNISHFSDDIRAFKAIDNRRHGLFTSGVIDAAEERLKNRVAQNLGFENIDQTQQPKKLENVITGAGNAIDAVDAMYAQKAQGAQEYLKRVKDDSSLVDIEPVLNVFEERHPTISKELSPTKQEYLETAPGEIYKKLNKASDFYNKKLKEKYHESNVGNIFLDKKTYDELKDFSPNTLDQVRSTEVSHLKIIQDKVREKLKDPKLPRGEFSELLDAKKEIDNIIDNRLKFYMDQGDTSASEAYKNLQEANKFYSDAMNERILRPRDKEGKITVEETSGTIPIAKKLLNSKTMQEAFDKVVSSGDHRYFATLKKGLDESSSNKLARDILAEVGTTKKDEFSPNRIASWFGDMSDQAKKEFLKLAFDKPENRKNFTHTIEFLAEQQKNFAKWGNPSKTSHNMNLNEIFKEPVKFAKKVASLAIKGAPGGGIAHYIDPVLGATILLGQMVTSNKMAKLLTDPEFLKRMNQVTKSKTPKQFETRAVNLLKTATPRVAQKSLRAAKIPIEQKDDDDDED